MRGLSLNHVCDAPMSQRCAVFTAGGPGGRAGGSACTNLGLLGLSWPCSVPAVGVMHLQMEALEDAQVRMLAVILELSRPCSVPAGGVVVHTPAGGAGGCAGGLTVASIMKERSHGAIE